MGVGVGGSPSYFERVLCVVSCAVMLHWVPFVCLFVPVQDNVAALQEIVGGVPVAPDTVEASLSGSTLTLSNVVLPASNPVRLFLLPYTQASA